MTGAPKQDVCGAWATTADVCSPCDDYAFDTALLERGLLAASTILFNLTGWRYPGICRETVRPHDQAACGRCGWVRNVGGLDAGSRFACGCGWLSEIRLGGRPVVRIVTVKVDGVDVPTDEYRVDNYGTLVGLTGAAGRRRVWPTCQRMDLPETDLGTFAVTYDFGVAPPVGGVVAAAALGCQLALAMSPETVGQCRLPKRVTSITRQGVSMAVLDPLTLIQDGMTGLPEVDLWVASDNRGRARRPGSLMIPGRGRNNRRPCC